ncbi:MAG: glycogen synthase GlgA [Planctomycetales bacterium]|nr:glycogen synthase GlgA [Planctomycetales bacterium]
MHILMATSEAVPFAKTGGLADVCGALPVELRRLGHQVSLIMPAYRHIHASGQRIHPTDVRFSIPIGNKTVTGGLLQSTLPDSDVPVYFVSQDEYFDRAELYREDGVDYIDNSERFVFFCRAVIEAIELLDLEVDVLHANDWPTGLIPAYLKTEYAGVPPYEQIASLLTIHNLAYQGQFWHWDMLLTGLDWKYFNWHQMEFYGNLNLMKTGIVFADAITTVSPQYAEEIQSAPLGCGLEGVLQSRRDVLSGVINGVDYRVWDPSVDSHIAAQFSPETVGEGKPACKTALQQTLGLPTVADVPLIGFIGRLADQKGLDLIVGMIHHWPASQPAQFALLGTGDPHYHETLTRLAAEQPERIAVRLEFSNALAHQMEAGLDMFLMPSRYEPCGLNQLYSLRYGTVPIVHATGGLLDTVTNSTEETLADGTATGFQIFDYSVNALDEATQRACALYHQPSRWRALMETGMKQDWSWARSAAQYASLYERIAARRRQQTIGSRR